MSDFRSFFEASPDAYLVLRADASFTVEAVNDAYLRLSRRRREQLLGRPFFDLFPHDPADSERLAVKALRDSLVRAIATRERHDLPPLRHALPRSVTAPGDQGFEERLWRVSHVPVPGPDGSVQSLLHRIEDVTTLVQLEQAKHAQQQANETLQATAASAQAAIASREQALAQTRHELAQEHQQLLESRIRLETAVDAGDIATFIWEPPSDRMYPDEALLRWFDFSPDRLRSGSLDEYLAAVHPDDLPSLQAIIDRARAGGPIPHTEFRLRRETEPGWRHVLARARRDVSHGGKPERVVGVLLDVSELRETTQALATIREQFHVSGEAADIGTFSISFPARKVAWSARCKEHLWLPPDAVETPELFYSILHPDDRGPIRAAIQRAVDEREPLDIQYRAVSPQGEIKWIHARGRGFYDSQGRPIRFDGITIDVTRQRQIETNLRETEARYRLVVDNLRDYAIFMLDDDGIVTHWNAGAERLLGYTEAEILGQSARILFTPEDRARGDPERELETAKACGSANDDRWHLRKDGSRFFVTGLMAALTDPQGRRIGMTKIMRDITDRHAAAAERDDLLERERLARAEAERIGRMKDEFLATLSHELRTPLNAILGWTEVLKEGGLPPEEVSAALEVIDRNTHVQAQLIEDLLDMSRIVSGKVRLNVGRVDPGVVILAAIESVQTAAAAKHIRIETDFRHEGAAVMGDRTRLQQIAWNLLSNAIKFTPPHGRVRVATWIGNNDVLFSVSDNGAGISPEFLPHVFERFRQADASTTRLHGGLGLGLSIVKQLAELHGGEIRVASGGAGQGATFTVSIPMLARPPADVPLAQESRKPPPDSRPVATDLAGIKVLVVEDEPDSASLAKRVLESHGCTVRIANSVTDALAIFSAFAPDVLLSDIGMPHQDGYDLITRIRQLPGGADLPAAALTALARREDIERTREAGFRTHVAKPVGPAKLVALVASLSGRA